MKHLLIATLLLVSIILIPGAALAQPQLDFVSIGSGAQEVPPVGSPTKAILRLNFKENLAAVDYRLIVRRGVGILAAHLHCATADVNGGVAVVLFAAGPVNVDGQLAAGRIRSSDIIPTVCIGHGAVALTINNVASLLAAIRADEVYLNVHSQANPAGEVRAQIFGD